MPQIYIERIMKDRYCNLLSLMRADALRPQCLSQEALDRNVQLLFHGNEPLVHALISLLVQSKQRLLVGGNCILDTMW